MALTDRQVTKVCPLNLEKFEDTKGLIRSRKSRKKRQYNGQRKKDKRTKSYLQKLDIKLKIANPTDNRLRVLQKGQ